MTGLLLTSLTVVVPSALTDTRRVVPVTRSRTKTSHFPFVSPGTRLYEELANATVFLCSERASYITGVSLNLDGGRLKGEDYRGTSLYRTEFGPVNVDYDVPNLPASRATTNAFVDTSFTRLKYEEVVTAGDPRASENMGLLQFQVLFFREHMWKTWPRLRASGATPAEIVAEVVAGLVVVDDDDDVVVVDKPVGVAAHPSPGWTGPTVVRSGSPTPACRISPMPAGRHCVATGWVWYFSSST